jgi:co-chaperonin GroES (HSP10)
MKLKPQSDRVLLEEVKEVQTSNGLFIPSNSAKTKIYKVLNKGSDCSDEFSVGDTVICTSYIDGEIKYKGKIYYITKEINILAKISNEG